MHSRVWRPSPNFDLRPEDARIEFLIMHYTACDLELSLKILTDGSASHPVSAHYVIDETGVIYHLVKEEHRAWHAGISAWRHYKGINAYSIGIELVNPGYGPHMRAYSKPQMHALIQLSQEIIEKHPIRPQFILGHADVAPMRKEDPGILFDWKLLKDSGIGSYVSPHPRPRIVSQDLHILSTDHWPLDVMLKVQQLLKQWGYVFSPDNHHEMNRVIHAFSAHYCPEYAGDQNPSLILKSLQGLLNV